MTGTSRKSAQAKSKKTGKKRRAGHQTGQSTSTLAFIDNLLLRKIRVTINGVEQDSTVLAAIIHRLASKELAGDAHASRVLSKYEHLAPAKQSSQAVTFIDDAYNRRLGTSQLKAADD